MSFFVVANFKSNLSQVEVKSWLEAVKPSPNVIIAPSFLHLSLVPSHFSLASQDVSPYPMGGYTGAVNAAQLKELGVSYCIVGHSERRRYFHESYQDVSNKITELSSAGITPILCLDSEDIAPQFASLDEKYYKDCIYCFEPSADIGGTTISDLDKIKEVQKTIRSFVSDCRFMYGGSVNADNITDLLNLDLSGVLVATASLDPQDFNAILVKIS